MAFHPQKGYFYQEVGLPNSIVRLQGIALHLVEMSMRNCSEYAIAFVRGAKLLFIEKLSGGFEFLINMEKCLNIIEVIIREVPALLSLIYSWVFRIENYMIVGFDMDSDGVY